MAQDYTQLVETFAEAVNQLELHSLLSGPHDSYPAYLTIYAGAGGTDAQDWTEMLLRMYCRWFDKRGFSYHILDQTPGEEAGIKSVSCLVKGDWVYGHLKTEHGIHRLVRQSPFNANSKRQTSFAAVEIMPEIDTDVSVGPIDSKDLKIDTYRASGAGGQHVNKTDSAVRITHLPTGLVATSQESRSQNQNKERAMNMLTSRLLILMQEQQQETLSQLRGPQQENGWGNHIRSYVLHPYKLIKDVRTQYETSQVQPTLDGDLDPFIHAALRLGKGTSLKN